MRPMVHDSPIPHVHARCVFRCSTPRDKFVVSLRPLLAGRTLYWLPSTYVLFSLLMSRLFAHVKVCFHALYVITYPHVAFQMRQ